MRSARMLAGMAVLAAMVRLGPATADAAQVAQSCPGKPLPHQVRQLTATFKEGGAGPADDEIAVQLDLCARAGPLAAYLVSFDIQRPVYADSDRNGDGRINRRDFCVETRDAFALRYGGPVPGRLPGHRVGRSELHRGGTSDSIAFSVRVDDIAAGLPRDSGAVVSIWAETRLIGATLAAPPIYERHRLLVDWLPVPNPTDACLLPEQDSEVLALPLAGAPSGSGPNLQACFCGDGTELRICTVVDCDSEPAQDEICGPACASLGGEVATACFFSDPQCVSP